MVGRRILAAVALALAAPPAADAAPVQLGGITFSDELGGLEIIRGWGSGRPEDPFVLVEQITDDGPAVLVVRGLRARFGNPAGTPHQVGFALTKIVTNRTTRDWHAFELELRELLSRTSPYEDGLSFGQATRQARTFRADRFADMGVMDEPLDAVSFSDGIVRPGETVTVSVVVTDYSPNVEFYLLQRRESPTARLDTPARRS